MKKILLCGFLFSGILAFGEGPTPTNAAPASPTAADDLSQYKTADALWVHLNTQVQTLSAGLQNQDPSVKDLVPQIQASANAMIQQFPKDAHAWDAKLLVIQTGGLAVRLQLPGAPTMPQLTQQLEDIAGNKDAPPRIQAEASASLISQAMALASQSAGDSTALWDGVDAKIAAFQKQFGPEYSFGGTHVASVMFHAQELNILKNSNNPARFQALLEQLSTDPHPELAAIAQQELATQKQLADLKSKPMDLKFAAVDGTTIDLAKLRGKVVLVDFWATWCPPCREEVPNVVATYKKYHDQGFEVLGISLDQDKDALLSFTKENGMVWPQYFDGKGWDNTISKSFGIDSIPAMWLVGKDGKVVTTDARGDLDGQVATLLKAP